MCPPTFFKFKTKEGIVSVLTPVRTLASQNIEFEFKFSSEAVSIPYRHGANSMASEALAHVFAVSIPYRHGANEAASSTSGDVAKVSIPYRHGANAAFHEIALASSDGAFQFLIGMARTAISRCDNGSRGC